MTGVDTRWLWTQPPREAHAWCQTCRAETMIGGRFEPDLSPATIERIAWEWTRNHECAEVAS